MLLVNVIETGANHARFMQKLGQESWKEEEEEEEEDQDIGANKVFKKVREKSKIRNSLDHEEKYDEKEPEEWHSEPGGVTDQPEALSHSGETNFRHKRRSLHHGKKFFSLCLRIIPNPLKWSHYEMMR
ncbi:low-temperature-induced 65 kDa protein-like [Brassica napus]|uniref:low-temperature-induced 65 kDa protein-like n=1 Tax=Brassica napus TaxID=3708 RepID=UPI002078B1F6|nr:low-temperature-induced 65 kDa protein-like [Brassica napus]